MEHATQIRSYHDMFSSRNYMAIEIVEIGAPFAPSDGMDAAVNVTHHGLRAGRAKYRQSRYAVISDTDLKAALTEDEATGAGAGTGAAPPPLPQRCVWSLLEKHYGEKIRTIQTVGTTRYDAPGFSRTQSRSRLPMATCTT